MTRQLLLATHNLDKARIIGGVIKRLHETWNVKSLLDIGVTTQFEEHGDLIARATSKAKHCANLVRQYSLPSFDLILGIDDGIVIPRLGIDSVESEALTDFILDGTLPIGEPVVIKEAFALFSFTDRLLDAVAEVPFRYIGNPRNVRRGPDTYSLKWVLSRQFDDIPLSELGGETLIEYYLSFFGRPLDRILLSSH